MKEIKIPVLDLRADISTNSFDEEENTIDVIASVGSRVRREPFFSEPFVEELEISDRAIRLERFRKGAPVLKDHDARSIDSQMGVVVGASIKDNQLRAKIKFSTREEFQPIIKDIRNNVIRNVSVGYKTHVRQELEEKDNGARVFRSTDWEPHEVSFVTIQADPDAGTRNDEQTLYTCKIIEKENSMENKTADKGNENRALGGCEKEETASAPVETRVAPKVDLDEIRKLAIENERNRVTEIRKACTQAGLKDKCDSFIEAGSNIEDVRKSLLEELAKRDAATPTKSTQFETGENLNKVGSKRGMENAILHRIDPAKYKLDEHGNHYRNMKLIDMVRDSLNSQGVANRNMAPMELAARGLHSTSDFPEVLANVTNKTLRQAYEESPQTFEPFTRRVTVSDFKQISRTQLGDAPQLLEKLENGEYQSGTISEAAEKYSVKEYGRIVPVGRRVIVDDDLSAFTRLPGMMGRQASNLESDLILAEITSNPTMADGNALFSVAHANLTTGPGTAISVTSLGVARALMRSQTSLDGSKLNLRPSLLYVPVALETLADQVTTTITPEIAGSVNPFAPNGRTPLMVGTEPRLDDDSALSWYLFSMLMDIDMMELATIEGEAGPMVDSMVDFYTDGIKFKIRHTIGVKAIDWRGMYKNVGA